MKLAYYKLLPYQRVVTTFLDEDDGQIYWQVTYPEIDENCMAIDRDRLRAIVTANEVFDDWVEMLLEQGEAVPLPVRLRKQEEDNDGR